MPHPRQIRLNAFDMACVGHIQHGLWTHPRDRSSDCTSLDHWVRTRARVAGSSAATMAE